ncbi:MAG TPA: type II secretion system protein GspG [Candidatus Saccharimonadales bacterium]|nr:type II secretion system protein GspG [Candidatus Saccharimonadales bacterium]
MKDNNRVMKTLAKGFTLIEMLVVLAILGLMAGVLLVTLNPSAQLQKSNDAHRKSDLEAIQRALELYYQDTGSYPASSVSYQIAPGGTAVAWGSTSWSAYIDPLPKDPIAANKYAYYSPAGGQSYYLYANLQRAGNDPGACNKGLACASIGGTVPSGISCGGVCNYGVSSPNTTP